MGTGTKVLFGAGAAVFVGLAVLLSRPCAWSYENWYRAIYRKDRDAEKGWLAEGRRHRCAWTGAGRNGA